MGFWIDHSQELAELHSIVGSRLPVAGLGSYCRCPRMTRVLFGLGIHDVLRLVSPLLLDHSGTPSPRCAVAPRRCVEGLVSLSLEVLLAGWTSGQAFFHRMAGMDNYVMARRPLIFSAHSGWNRRLLLVS